MKPMLAKVYKESWAKPEFFLQPKLDGVRLIWDGSVALSRQGKEITGCPELVKTLEKHFSGVPLDGELYCHEKSFQEQLGSIRRSTNIDEDLAIQYWVYDAPVADLTFLERLELLQGYDLYDFDRLKLVPTVSGTLDDYEDTSLNIFGDEYEGTMLRNADGLYKFGKRSSDLLKIKSTLEDEFECVGVTPYLEHEKIIVPPGTPGAKEHAGGVWKKNGKATVNKTMIGALVCQTAFGVEFEVGTGFTEAMRREFKDNPPIGKMITVVYQELTDMGKPRFSRFKAVRDYE